MIYEHIDHHHRIVFADEMDYLRCKLLYLERSETNTTNAPFGSFISFVESGYYRGAPGGRIQVLDIDHNHSERGLRELQGGIFGSSHREAMSRSTDFDTFYEMARREQEAMGGSSQAQRLQAHTEQLELAQNAQAHRSWTENRQRRSQAEVALADFENLTRGLPSLAETIEMIEENTDFDKDFDKEFKAEFTGTLVKDKEASKKKSLFDVIDMD